MATPQNASLNDTTSFLSVYSSTGSFFYKNILLPSLSASTIGRVVYFKEASEYPGVPTFTLSTTNSQNLIELSTTVGLSRYQALTLQAVQSSTTLYWSLLNGYNGKLVVSSQQLPTLSVPIYVSSASQIFVDLRTQSKTVVLPQIQAISQASSSALYMTIKDAFGWASTSTMYISSSYPDTLEMSSINNAFAIQSNYASLDLIANPMLRKWNILNYYTGEFVRRP